MQLSKLFANLLQMLIGLTLTLTLRYIHIVAETLPVQNRTEVGLTLQVAQLGARFLGDTPLVGVSSIYCYENGVRPSVCLSVRLY